MSSGQRYNIKMEFYYTYVLRSTRDSRHYIGSTANLEQRLKAHNSGDVDSTKDRRPLELVYYEACLDRKKAEGRERYFKTGFGRKFLKSRLNSAR